MADSAPQFIVYDILCFVTSLIWPYFFCYFATFASDRVSSIGNIAYTSNWYEYPQPLRRYIILIVALSQQPIHFSGLGIIRCTLETFGGVSSIKWADFDRKSLNFLKKFGRKTLQFTQNRKWFCFSAHQFVM